MLISQPSNRMEKVSPFHVMDVMTRAKKMEAAGHDIVHMEVGEPDFSTAQPIVDAGIEFLQQAAPKNIRFLPAAVWCLRGNRPYFYNARCVGCVNGCLSDVAR